MVAVVLAGKHKHRVAVHTMATTCRSRGTAPSRSPIYPQKVRAEELTGLCLLLEFHLVFPRDFTSVSLHACLFQLSCVLKQPGHIKYGVIRAVCCRIQHCDSLPQGILPHEIRRALLSNNFIRDISSLPTLLPKLSELSLASNVLETPADLAPLQRMPHLKSLWLAGNPAMHKIPHARAWVITLVPALQVLDGVPISDTDRATAASVASTVQASLQGLYSAEVKLMRAAWCTAMIDVHHELLQTTWASMSSPALQARHAQLPRLQLPASPELWHALIDQGQRASSVAGALHAAAVVTTHQAMPRIFQAMQHLQRLTVPDVWDAALSELAAAQHLALAQATAREQACWAKLQQCCVAIMSQVDRAAGRLERAAQEQPGPAQAPRKPAMRASAAAARSAHGMRRSQPTQQAAEPQHHGPAVPYLQALQACSQPSTASSPLPQPPSSGTSRIPVLCSRPQTARVPADADSPRTQASPAGSCAADSQAAARAVLKRAVYAWLEGCAVQAAERQLLHGKARRALAAWRMRAAHSADLLVCARAVYADTLRHRVLRAWSTATRCRDEVDLHDTEPLARAGPPEPAAQPDQRSSGRASAQSMCSSEASPLEGRYALGAEPAPAAHDSVMLPAGSLDQLRVEHADGATSPTDSTATASTGDSQPDTLQIVHSAIASIDELPAVSSPITPLPASLQRSSDQLCSSPSSLSTGSYESSAAQSCLSGASAGHPLGDPPLKQQQRQGSCQVASGPCNQAAVAQSHAAVDDALASACEALDTAERASAAAHRVLGKLRSPPRRVRPTRSMGSARRQRAAAKRLASRACAARSRSSSAARSASGRRKRQAVPRRRKSRLARPPVPSAACVVVPSAWRSVFSDLRASNEKLQAQLQAQGHDQPRPVSAAQQALASTGAADPGMLAATLQAELDLGRELAKTVRANAVLHQQAQAARAAAKQARHVAQSRATQLNQFKAAHARVTSALRRQIQELASAPAGHSLGSSAGTPRAATESARAQSDVPAVTTQVERRQPETRSGMADSVATAQAVIAEPAASANTDTACAPPAAAAAAPLLPNQPEPPAVSCRPWQTVAASQGGKQPGTAPGRCFGHVQGMHHWRSSHPEQPALQSTSAWARKPEPLLKKKKGGKKLRKRSTSTKKARARSAARKRQLASMHRLASAQRASKPERPTAEQVIQRAIAAGTADRDDAKRHAVEDLVAKTLADAQADAAKIQQQLAQRRGTSAGTRGRTRTRQLSASHRRSVSPSPVEHAPRSSSPGPALTALEQTLAARASPGRDTSPDHAADTRATATVTSAAGAPAQADTSGQATGQTHGTRSASADHAPGSVSSVASSASSAPPSARPPRAPKSIAAWKRAARSAPSSQTTSANTSPCTSLERASSIVSVEERQVLADQLRVKVVAPSSAVETGTRKALAPASAHVEYVTAASQQRWVARMRLGHAIRMWKKWKADVTSNTAHAAALLSRAAREPTGGTHMLALAHHVPAERSPERQGVSVEAWSRADKHCFTHGLGAQAVLGRVGITGDLKEAVRMMTGDGPAAPGVQAHSPRLVAHISGVQVVDVPVSKLEHARRARAPVPARAPSVPKPRSASAGAAAAAPPSAPPGPVMPSTAGPYNPRAVGTAVPGFAADASTVSAAQQSSSSALRTQASFAGSYAARHAARASCSLPRSQSHSRARVAHADHSAPRKSSSSSGSVDVSNVTCNTTVELRAMPGWGTARGAAVLDLDDSSSS